LKNLFSVSTEDFFENLYKIDKSDLTKIDKLYSDTLDQIPLYITEKHPQLLNNPNISINDIADYCIDICTPYFKFEVPKKESIGISPWVQLYNYISGKRLNDTDTQKEERRFKDNIKSFLIYSFLYRQSQAKKPFVLKKLVNSPFFPEGTTPNSISAKLKKLNHLENITSSKDKSTPLKKLRFGDAQSTSALFHPSKNYLDFIINYTNLSKPIKRRHIDINSYHDIIIFRGLISTTSVSCNPYLLPYSDKKEDKIFCNIQEFLSYFSPLSNSNNLEDFCAAVNKYTNLYPCNEYSSNSSNYFLDMHSILTEKVTNINLINAIYKNRDILLHRYKLNDALYNLAGYPLLRYRVHLIDNFQRILMDDTLKETSTEELNTLASRIFRHQIFCTFPILDIIFNVFLLKAGFFNKPICLDTSIPSRNTHDVFFSYKKTASTKEFSMIPTLSVLSPTLTANYDNIHHYSDIVSSVYNAFGTFILKGAKHPIIEREKTLISKAKKACYKENQQRLSKKYNELRCAATVYAETPFWFIDDTD